MKELREILHELHNALTYAVLLFAGCICILGHWPFVAWLSIIAFFILFIRWGNKRPFPPNS